MARQARRLVDGGAYHVTAYSTPTLALFRDPADYEAYLMMFAQAKRQTGLQLYHYCLLPAEVHLIVELPRAKALARTLHLTHLCFRWHRRKTSQLTGPLWRDRFQSERVVPGDLLSAGQRVELLPVHTQLTTHPAEYAYSSYAWYALGRANRYLDVNPQYLTLGATPHHRQTLYGQLTTAESINRLQPRLAPAVSGRFPHASAH